MTVTRDYPDADLARRLDQPIRLPPASPPLARMYTDTHPLSMEPTGIEPVTSCLQSELRYRRSARVASEHGRLGRGVIPRDTPSHPLSGSNWQ